MRRLVPLFITLEACVVASGGYGSKTSIEIPRHKYNGAEYFYFGRRRAGGYIYGWNNSYQGARLDQFENLLVRAIRHFEIVSPCLQIPICTEDAIEKCIASLTAIHIARKKCTQIISSVLIMLAVTREAIQDSDKFIENFAEDKQKLQSEWNSFIMKYKFAEHYLLWFFFGKVASEKSLDLETDNRGET